MDGNDTFGPPMPKPRTLLQPIGVGDESTEMAATGRKKKKTGLSRLKDRKKESDMINGSGEHAHSQEHEEFGINERLNVLDISNLPDDERSHTPPSVGETTPNEPSTPTSTRKKKKHKGALSRLKEKQALPNDSQLFLRSEEMSDLRQVDDEPPLSEVIAPDVTDSSGIADQAGDNILSQEKANSENTHAKHGKVAVTQNHPGNSNSTFKPVVSDGEEVIREIDMRSAVESDEMLEDYKQMLDECDSDDEVARKPAFPLPKPSASTPQRMTSVKAEPGMTKAGSMPDISASVRSSRRNWDVFKSKIGLDASTDLDVPSAITRSFSGTSLNSSCLHSVRISSARHKNFLVGQQNSHSSAMGASELERMFPDRNINIFVGTWNLGDLKSVNESVEDFVLPTALEYVPDLLVITSQENQLDRKEWEVNLQETIGLNHVIYHSAQHGTLHMAICMKRELIWYCSVAEEDRVTVRAFKQVKTKGAVAISFTMFGTSFLFICSHLKAGDNNKAVRVQDIQSIIKKIRLPRAVIDNPLQEVDPQSTRRFDCVFWAGDLNFRITKQRDMVLNMIAATKENDNPDFEQLLDGEELTEAMGRGEVFEDFQEGQIRFPPTYKFDIGTDNYDTSPKYRIPSYTDRILFRCKKKHSIICLKYNSSPELKCSDHKPVYGLYQVNLKPGRDTIPLAGGQFRRDVYLEASRRRALHREVSTMKLSPTTAKSSVCSIS